MSRRTFKSDEKLPLSGNSETQITSLPVAVYYRQSTTAQVGNISTSIQTIDMVEELKQRGWNEKDIILIDNDEGVSGTTRIDEREGMSQLFELIADAKIGSVAVQDEDRLFRDLTQIQVNIFIDACRKSCVKIITPYFTYDFSHPSHGEFHARQFRFKCDMAAEFIKSYILGRLSPAKRRLRSKGLWAGAATPAGYMVDMRGKLPDGSDNPKWRKFIPLEPQAEVIREYYRIFIENNGEIRKSMRQIRDEGLSLPDAPIPEGFKTNSQLKRRKDGYFINRSNFVRMLTNPVYIGHWMTKGIIAVWDNHEPIIDSHIFMRAFNYLSPHSLTGDVNPHYQPAYQYKRPTETSERKAEIPLCAGLIYTDVEDRTYKAGMYDKRTKQYLYVLHRVEIDGTHIEWARRATWIDQAVIKCFRTKLEETYKADIWQSSLDNKNKFIEKDRKIKRFKLKSVQQEKENLLVSLRTLKHQYMIQDVETRFGHAEREEKRLINELANLEEQSQQHISIEQAYSLFERVIGNWDNMTQAERKNVLSLFVERIDASGYDRSGTMLLTIYWKDDTSEKIEIWHKPKSKHWTMENTNKVLAMFDEGLGQLEIAKEFPTLKWYQIFNEIKKHRGKIRFPIVFMGKQETYEDYLASGGRKGVATCSQWRPEEVDLLKEMVVNGATQLEIMEQFPVRRWVQLRAKIKQVFNGKFMPISTQVSQDLTYHEYAGEQKVVNKTAVRIA